MFSFYWLGLKKIFNFGKKILLVILVYFTVVSLFLYFINKEKPKITYDPIKKNREEIYKVINDPQLNKTNEGKIMIASYRLMLCGMIGEACTNNPDDGDKNFNRSLFGFIANLFVLPYVNPPASGVYWTYSGLQNAGFVPKTYAAEGIGFSAIKPLMDIWKIFRDLSYMLLVLVLISIGFMIMFRAKINPQTVITIENSIPKIVITLLIITMSFPIVGFLIDLMYLAIAFTISLLNPGDLTKITNQFNDVTLGGAKDLIKEMISMPNFFRAATGFIGIFPGAIQVIIQLVLSSLAVRFINFITSGRVEAVSQSTSGIPAVGPLINNLIKFLVIYFFSPLLLRVFLVIVLFLTTAFLYFRIFFLLFVNYIELLVYIIFSPLILVFEALPGKSSFSFWLKKIFFNIFIFYFVFTILHMTQYISAIMLSSKQQLWQPPFISGIDYQFFPGIIALGFLLITPDIIKFLKQSFGAKDVFPSFNLGTFFGGLGIAWGGLQGGIGIYSSFLQMPLIGQAIRTRLEKTQWGKKLFPPSAESQQLAEIKKILENK